MLSLSHSPTLSNTLGVASLCVDRSSASRRRFAASPVKDRRGGMARQMGKCFNGLYLPGPGHQWNMGIIWDFRVKTRLFCGMNIWVYGDFSLDFMRYTLWLFNGLLWKAWPKEINTKHDVLPNLNMVIVQFATLNNQRVYLPWSPSLGL
jgi:hypothetical protein